MNPRFPVWPLVLLAASCAPAPPPPAFVDGTCHAPGEVHVLATGEPGLRRVLVHGDHVYWTGEAGPRRLPVNGGPVESLVLPTPPASSDQPIGLDSRGLVIDDHYLYFGATAINEISGVWRIPPSGGIPERVALLDGKNGPTRMLTDERWLWAVDPEFGSLFRIDKREPPSLLSVAFANGDQLADGLAIDDERVFWGNRTAAKDGFDFRGFDVGSIDGGVALVGDDVFFASRYGITHCHRDGSCGARITATALDLVAHGGKLFWAVPGPGGGFGSMAADGSGLAVVPVADAPNPFAISVSDDAVYLLYSLTNDGQVVKVCR